MSITPNALCFGPDLPGSGTPCHVEVSSSGLSLTFPEGADAVTVAFSSLTLDAGGFDHNQLIVKWSEGAVERTLDDGVVVADRACTSIDVCIPMAAPPTLSRR